VTAALRVVVVEDSPTQRAHLVRLLEEDLDIEVVAVAATREKAVAAVVEHHPDVVTMDLVLEGPAIDHAPAGLGAIRDVMALAPTPILVVSSHIGDRASLVAIDALAAGAADAFPRPSAWTEEQSAALREQVRILSGVAVVRRRPPPDPAVLPPRRGGRPVVALGASTGGPPALSTVLETLQGIQAPVLVVQHLHPDFVESFTAWLRKTTNMKAEVVREPVGQPRDGQVYVAPADRHLCLDGRGSLTLLEAPASLHRPAVDELFRSVATHSGGRAVAALLTGMGEDGARGLRAIRDSGGVTIAQDEATSAVYGMPRAALQHDAAEAVLPLTEIGPAIRRALARVFV